MRCGASPIVLAALVACAAGLAPGVARSTAPPHRGAWPAELESARRDGLLTASPRSIAPDGPATGEAPRQPPFLAPALVRPSAGTQATGAWNVPLLLVSFTDAPPAHDAAGFEPLLFDTTGANPDGSLAEYFDEISRGALRVRGQVFGWYALPQTRNYYAANSFGTLRMGTPRNAAGLALHAVAAADAEVDFSQFDRDGDGEVDVVLVGHTGLGAEFTPSDNTQFWSISSQLASGWSGVQPYVTNDPVPGGFGENVVVNRFAIVPELSGTVFGARVEIGVYCHEFGHALGWPDLYDASTLGGSSNLGPANWCLMATGLYGGESLSPQRPTRPCAWALADAGWAAVENLTESGEVSFEPVDAANRIYRLWWEGQTSSEYYLVENRRRRGFDADLPGEGLLVYHVEADVIAASRTANRINSGYVPGLRVEEADGLYDLVNSANRADASDPFPGAGEAIELSDDTQPSLRTYAGRYSNLALTGIRQNGDRVDSWVQLQPTGWSEPQVAAIPGLPRLGTGRVFAMRESDLHLVYQDDANLGRVHAMQYHFGAYWGPPAEVAQSALASDAAWSAGSGALAALWTDRRHGLPTIYYRVWAPAPGPEERAVHATDAFATRPAGAWGPGGQLHVVWVDSRYGTPLLFHRRFMPGSAASAEELPVLPSAPGEEVLEFSLDASPSQIFVAYTMRGGEGDEVHWTRFTAANGWSAPLRLSGLDGYPSGVPDVRVQGDGRVRVVWRDLGPTRNSVRTVLFDPTSGNFVSTLNPLFVTPLALASVRFASDPSGHELVAARASESPLDRILVAHRHDDGAWDAGLGSVSQGIEAANHRLAAFFQGDGAAVLAWAGPFGDAGQVAVRKRRDDAASLVGVPPGAPATDGTLPLRAYPNPASRAGVRFVLAEGWHGQVALYSPAGRRVARLETSQGAAVWNGRDDAGLALAPGVYLYRLEAGGRASRAGKLVWIP